MMMLINNIHNTLNTPFHPILTHDVVDNTINTINTLNTLSSNFNPHDVVKKQISQADKVQETLTQQGLEEAGLETSSRLDFESNGDSSMSADFLLIIIMMISIT